MEAFLKKARGMARLWLFVSFCTLCWWVYMVLLTVKLQEMYQDHKELLKGILIASACSILVLHVYLFLIGNIRFHSWVKMKQALLLFQGRGLANEQDFIDIYWVKKNALKICFLQILGIFFFFDIVYKLRINRRLRAMYKRIKPKLKENEEIEVVDEYDNTLDNISGNEAVY